MPMFDPNPDSPDDFTPSGPADFEARYQELLIGVGVIGAGAATFGALGYGGPVPLPVAFTGFCGLALALGAMSQLELMGRNPDRRTWLTVIGVGLAFFGSLFAVGG